MNKFLSSVAVLFVLSLGFAAASHAASMAQGGLTTYDTSKLIGLTVMARNGVKLGQIFDLVANSNGRLDFAIVMQPGFEEFPGRLVVVPFATLTLSNVGPHNIRVVFREDKEKFYEGPDWTGKLNDLKQVASVDRYFGIQPYWTEGTGGAGCSGLQPSRTEGGHTSGTNAYRWGGTAQDF